MSTISKERFNEILREEIVREREEQKVLNEFFGMGDFASGVMGTIGRGEGIFGGAIKQKIADLILIKLDVKDPNVRLILSEIIEQLTVADIKQIYQGGADQCDFATEKIFKALCETAGRKLYELGLNALSDIPEIGAIAGWLGGGGALNQAAFGLTAEAIEEQLSDPNTAIGGWMHANVLPPLREKVCKIVEDVQGAGIKDIALGKETGSVTDSAPAETAFTPQSDSGLA